MLEGSVILFWLQDACLLDAERVIWYFRYQHLFGTEKKKYRMIPRGEFFFHNRYAFWLSTIEDPK